ncbi:hypothetical protein [Streptomyces sp. NBC_00690]|uniref:hypothetical protein n=1 Tax=Streptomyces sp. NBC_00690 TaxID=2975808 RepID=UPI002E2AFDF2|nr:hypothetical protein [Streptomyces sp. NBC_00690]
MMVRLDARCAAAAALVAALLVAGCGGSGKDDGQPDSGTHERAKTLTQAEIKAVLPQASDLPGAKRNSSTVLDLSAGSDKRPCAGGQLGKCVAAKGVGTTVLTKEGEGDFSFTVFAHRDTEAARNAYPFLWKDAATAWIIPAETAKIGKLGDQSGARRGEHNDGLGSYIQIQVGPTLLAIKTSSGVAHKPHTDKQLKELAEMFTQRARQAHDGDLPTASLRS